MSAEETSHVLHDMLSGIRALAKQHPKYQISVRQLSVRELDKGESVKDILDIIDWWDEPKTFMDQVDTRLQDLDGINHENLG